MTCTCANPGPCTCANPGGSIVPAAVTRTAGAAAIGAGAAVLGAAATWAPLSPAARGWMGLALGLATALALHRAGHSNAGAAVLGAATALAGEDLLAAYLPAAH